MKNPKQRKVMQRFDDKFYEEVLNKNRTIMLYQEINEESAKNVNTKLIAMATLAPKKPIILEINTPGGSCVDGMAIIDTMQRINVPVYTIINGYAASMGSFISIVGTYRFITKNAYYMMHPMAAGTYDYLPYIRDKVKFLEEFDARMETYYKKYTRLPMEIIEKAKNGEVWLNAEKCLEYGVVDKIL